MSETAPLPPRAPSVTEAPPVPPTPQKGSQSQQQPTPQQNTPGGANTQTAPSAAFKDPAIALSPRVAGIAVGDILQGTVERIDQQQRAVLQNGRETLLVDPAADLKTGTAAKVRVTQTAPLFLGQLLSQDPKAKTDLPVRLALVAVRGLEMAPPPAPKNAAAPIPKPATLMAAASQQPNRLQDLLAALPQKAVPSPQAAANAQTAAPQGVSASSKDIAALQRPPQPAPPLNAPKQASTTETTAQSARPTLLQALVRTAEGPQAQASTSAFVARHPDIGYAAKPLTMTLLPSSPAQAAYARAPAPASPVGQLIASGRAVLVSVESVPAAQAPATARTLLAAGPIRIEIPALPDLPLRAGEKVVLLSASAEPLPERNQTLQNTAAIVPKAASTQHAAAAQIAAGTAVTWPALHTLIAQGVQSFGAPPTFMSSRTSQLLSAVLGLTAPGEAQTSVQHKLTLPPIVKDHIKPDDALKAVINSVNQTKADLERLWTAQQDPAQQALSAAASAARADVSVLPLVLPNSEATLIASLFLYPAEADETAPDERGQRQEKEGDDAKSFEVALTFPRFGQTTLSGTLSVEALTLRVETQTPLPDALVAELTDVFTDQCTSCALRGAIEFQSAA